jgi:hypothetical protein
MNGNGLIDATACTTASTIMDTSGITAGSISQLEGHAATIHQSVDAKLAEFDNARQIQDANFTSRMNNIDDSIKRIQDDLNAIADAVTTRVLTGLQKPDGIPFKQDAKIDLIQAQLLKMLPIM